MGITSTSDSAGITTVTVDFPPVNALPSQAWFDLAEAVTTAGRSLDTHAVILRAEAEASTRVWTSRKCRPPKGSTP